MLTVEQVLAVADEVGPAHRTVVLLGAFCCLRLGSSRRCAETRSTWTVHGEGRRDRRVRHRLRLGERRAQERGRASARVTNPAEIVPDVRAHLLRYSQEGPDGLVFVGPQGGVLRGSTFTSRVFAPAVRRLGLPGTHSHDLSRPRICAACSASAPRPVSILSSALVTGPGTCASGHTPRSKRRKPIPQANQQTR